MNDCLAVTKCLLKKTLDVKAKMAERSNIKEKKVIVIIHLTASVTERWCPSRITLWRMQQNFQHTIGFP